MTELEQLSNFIAFYNREKENVGYTGLDNWLDEFGPGFLNSLKGHDSSADNNSDIVSVNKLELASEMAHAMLFEKFRDVIGFDEDELFDGENYKPEFQDEFNHLYDNAIKVIETCRTMPNSADNNKIEQSINQEQMKPQIEDMACDLAKTCLCKEVFYAKIKETFAFEHFQQELKDCFAMHFKVNSKPLNVSAKQLHSDEELMSKEELDQLEFKVWSLVRRTHKELTPARELLGTQESALKIIDLVLGYRNTVSTADKYSIDVNTDAMKLPCKTVVLERIETISPIQIQTLITDRGEWGSNDMFQMSVEDLEFCSKEITDFVLGYQKCDSTAVKQQNDNLVNEDKLRSEIESIIYQSDYFDWSVTAPDVKRLLELFKTYQNSVLRPVKD